MVKGLPGVWVWSGDLEQLPMSVTSGVVGDSDDQYHPYPLYLYCEEKGRDPKRRASQRAEPI